MVKDNVDIVENGVYTGKKRSIQKKIEYIIENRVYVYIMEMEMEMEMEYIYIYIMEMEYIIVKVMLK